LAKTQEPVEGMERHVDEHGAYHGGHHGLRDLQFRTKDPMTKFQSLINLKSIVGEFNQFLSITVPNLKSVSQVSHFAVH